MKKTLELFDNAKKEILKFDSNIIKENEFEKFTVKQLQLILVGLQSNLDVSTYANPNIEHQVMVQILFGLREGLDVTLFNNPKLSTIQVYLILDGIDKGIDVTKYNNPTLNEIEMAQIKARLVDNLTCDAYKFYEIDHDLVEEKEFYVTQLYLRKFGKEQVNRILNIKDDDSVALIYEFEDILMGE